MRESSEQLLMGLQCAAHHLVTPQPLFPPANMATAHGRNSAHQSLHTVLRRHPCRKWQGQCSSALQ